MSVKNPSFERDLVSGNVVKQLISFALPFLISNLIQTLYSVADMIIVGRFTGAAAMSGVNIGSQVTFIITNMVFGLCVGATVLIAQYLGAGDKNAIRETIGTLFSTLIVLSVVITVVMLGLQTPLLRLIKTPAESFADAKSYFFVTMLGTVFIFAYNALSAVMRGMGDSKNPLIFVAIACVCNIVLDLFFVAGLRTGAAGAAIATVISQGVSVVLCVLYLMKNGFIFDFKPSSFRFHGDRLKTLLRVGIPTSIQNVAVGISFLFLTTLVNMIGFTASAAVGAVGKFNGFAILPAAAMSSSVSAMSAQNIGAGQIERAKKTMHVGIVIAAVISAIIFVLVTIWPQAILEIFVDKSDPDFEAVVTYGVNYVKSFKFDYLLVPFVFCLNGLFIGAGHTTFSLVNSCLSSLIFRIPLSYIFGMVLSHGITGVGLGAPGATAASLVFGLIYYFSGKWKKSTVVDNVAVLDI
jgi:putative MATE family efflux protein